MTGANPMVGGDSTGLKKNRSCKTNKRQKDRIFFKAKPSCLTGRAKQTRDRKKKTSDRKTKNDFLAKPSYVVS